MDDSPVYYSPGEHRQSGMSGCTFALLGCGVVALLIIVAVGIGVWYVTTNIRSIASDVIGAVVTNSVEQSKLPEDQKARIIARIAQVKEDFKAGRITDQQAEQVFENLMESPLLPLGAVEFYEEHYIKSSELSDEEKQAAVRSLERFARGIAEEKTEKQAVDEVIAPISEAQSDGERKLKENPTPDELRAMVKLAKAHADEANIPDEPFTVNVADELDRAIDAGLAGKSLKKKKEPKQEAKQEQVPRVEAPDQVEAPDHVEVEATD